MQKRVVYNFNAQTATESAAENSTGKAVKASNAISKIKRVFSGKSIKLAVLVVLLFVSLFCTIGSADWIISQQKNVPNSQDGSANATFKFDDLGLNNHIDIPNVAFSGNPAQANFKTTAPNSGRDLPAEVEQNIQYKVKPYNQTSAQSRVSRAPKNAAASSAKNMAPAAYANETLPDEKFFDGIEWTKQLPTYAGTYAVLITSKVGEVSYGKAIKVFTIAPCPVRIVWSGNQGFTYDGTAHPITAAAHKADENGTPITENILSISLTYKAPGAADSTAATTVTEVKNAGTYTATASINNNKNYAISDGEETTVTFTVTRADNAWITEPTIVANDYSDGNIFIHDVYTAKATVLSGENPTITYSSSENGVFAATQPTTAGTYYAKFIAPETTNYSKIEKTISFTIKQNIITYIDKDGSSIIATDYNGRNFDLRPYTTKNDFQYVRTAKWSDGTTKYTPGESVSGITSDRTFRININLTEKVYTLNIWYKDKDNQVSSVKTNSDTAVSTYNNQVYNFVEKIGSTTKNNVKYNDSVNLKRQIRLSESYNYYYMSGSPASATKGTRYINIFYMSPIEQLNWHPLYTNYKDTKYTVTTNDYLATVSGSTITLIVLCVQPQAIVSSSTIADTTNTNYSNVTYYADANDAFSACQSVNSRTFLRIYGQGQYAGNTLSYHCLTTNKSINSYNFSLQNGESFTTQKYTIDVSGYTINSERFSNNYIINNNLTVILPHGRDDSSEEGFLRAQSDGGNASKGGSYIQSILIIPQNFTMTVNGTLTIGAAITAEGTVNAHGVLMNNGEIVVSAGKSLTAMGYIKGTGRVELKETAIINDVFKIYDWAGGSNSLGIYDAGLFPFRCYSFHNISCKVKIPFGATYRAWAQLYMAGSWVTQQYISILGNGGLYALTNTDGYVEKYVEDTTDNTNINSFTSSNQNITQREVIDIYGSFNDNTISVKAKALFIEKTITTSPSLSMPMGFINISIKKGTGTLKASSYSFLPGSKVTVEEGASLTIDNNVTAIFYDQFPDDYNYINNGNTSGYSNPYSYRRKHPQIYAGGTTDSSNNDVLQDYYSKLIVNGTLNVKGSLGGIILSTTAKGKTILTNAIAATTKELNTLTYKRTGSTATTTNQTYQTKGYLQANASDVSAFANKGTYCSFIGQQGYYWTNENNIKTLQLELNGGSYSGDTTFINEKGTIITLPIEGITKEHYLFIGWFDELNNKYESITLSDSSPDVLHARWTPKKYNIEYIHIGCTNEQLATITSDNPTQYTYNEKLVLNTPTSTSPELNFMGWFSNEECTAQITEIAIGTHGNITIYGKWTTEQLKNYTITYKSGLDEVSLNITTAQSTGFASGFTYEIPTIKATWDGKTATLSPDFMNSTDLNTLVEERHYNFSKYFAGWYVYSASDGKTLLDTFYETCPTIEKAEDVILIPIWKNKAVLQVSFANSKGSSFVNGNNTFGQKTKYFTPGCSINNIIITAVCNKFATDISTFMGKQYQFTKYSTAQGDNADIDFPSDDGAIVGITASYTRYYYINISGNNISVSGNNPYTVEPTTSSFKISDKVTLSEGYEIKNYTINGVDTDSDTINLSSYDPYNNITVVVNTQLKQYILTITQNEYSGGITVTDSTGKGYTNGASISHGTNITIKTNSNTKATIEYDGNTTTIAKNKSHQINPVKSNIKITGEKDGECLIEGTLITLANGTKKKVEDLKMGDVLLVYNHETGKLDGSPLLVNVHADEEKVETNIINLKFSNGSLIRICYEHGLFDNSLNKYVYINENNYLDYLGHSFYSASWNENEFIGTTVKLVNAYITTETVKLYNPASVWHLNLFAENMLTLSAGMTNFFEYDENMKYDEELMKADIEKYGLYTYEDFKDYVSEEVFNAFPFKYFKVAVSKGEFTFEKILWLIDFYNDSTSLK